MRSPRGWAEALLQEDRQAAEVAAAQSSHDASTIRAAAEALSRQAADQQLPPSRFMDFVDQLAAGRVTVGSDGQVGDLQRGDEMKRENSPVLTAVFNIASLLVVFDDPPTPS